MSYIIFLKCIQFIMKYNYIITILFLFKINSSPLEIDIISIENNRVILTDIITEGLTTDMKSNENKIRSEDELNFCIIKDIIPEEDLANILENFSEFEISKRQLDFCSLSHFMEYGKIYAQLYILTSAPCAIIIDNMQLDHCHKKLSKSIEVKLNDFRCVSIKLLEFINIDVLHNIFSYLYYDIKSDVENGYPHITHIVNIFSKSILNLDNYDQRYYEDPVNHSITPEFYINIYALSFSSVYNNLQNNLCYLNLAYCNLGEFPDIEQLINLKTISLHENNISEVPVWLNNFKNLETLYLSYNKLKSLPNIMLNQLKYLDLSYNPINLDNIKFNTMCPNLVEINLECTQAYCFPKNLAECRNLQYVVMYNNQLNNNIPNNINTQHDEYNVIKVMLNNSNEFIQCYCENDYVGEDMDYVCEFDYDCRFDNDNYYDEYDFDNMPPKYMQ